MFAKEDFEEIGSPLSSCYGCGKPILDRFLLTVLEKEGHQFDSWVKKIWTIVYTVVHNQLNKFSTSKPLLCFFNL
jgi:hypothetical protein